MWPKWLTAEFWKGIWDDFVEFMSDLPIKVLKGFLDGVLEVLKAVQSPEFLAQYKLSDVMGGASSDIGYFLYNSQIGTALAIIAAAVIFRIVRKAVTLGRW
ncbi:hypothetical protein [Pseudomonas aeruginosa]|uniref:hypothetical protein n=1 Tax=Pseudomonas aeruginosa TaxID=287 RepID=UPI00136EB885|nr:hypothetical protein [Pseudomonas aeruginosa]MYM53139.1 hypothetical protein [Pseudomonas aeruginosa]